MITCDHSNCPANAAATITTPAGDIDLCGHHLTENEPSLRAKGYTINLRFWIIKELPDGSKLMRDHNGVTGMFVPE